MGMAVTHMAMGIMAAAMAIVVTMILITTAIDAENNSSTVNRKNFRKNGDGLMHNVEKLSHKGKRRDIHHLRHARSAVHQDSPPARTNVLRRSVEMDVEICASPVDLDV